MTRRPAALQAELQAMAQATELETARANRAEQERDRNQAGASEAASLRQRLRELERQYQMAMEEDRRALDLVRVSNQERDQYAGQAEQATAYNAELRAQLVATQTTLRMRDLELSNARAALRGQENQIAEDAAALAAVPVAAIRRFFLTTTTGDRTTECRTVLAWLDTQPAEVQP